MSVARPIADYKGLIEACRDRADELAISRLEIDRLGGLPQGYTSKILNRGMCQKRNSKRMWPVGLEAVLGALGLRILLIEDTAATERTLSLREPVCRAQQRFSGYRRGPRPVLVEAPRDTEATAA